MERISNFVVTQRRACEDAEIILVSLIKREDVKFVIQNSSIKIQNY